MPLPTLLLILYSPQGTAKLRYAARLARDLCVAVVLLWLLWRGLKDLVEL